ncbi:hypothetical protein ACNHUS_36105 [Actinomycetes bacterium M1A6_2h]
MRIDFPPEMFGGRPAGLLDHFGLDVEQRPDPGSNTWHVSSRPLAVLTSKVVHGPALSRSRFDVSDPPTPLIPGGMGPDLSATFDDLIRTLDEAQTLPARFERIITTLVAATDSQVPASIRWGSDTLAAMTLDLGDGHTEPLFPHHSVHDIRLHEMLYRWSKLPQIFLRLQYNTVGEVIAESKVNPDSLAFQASSGLLEGTILGGTYFAPLLGNLTPTIWGFASPRLGQLVLYTLGRQLPGLGHGASRDSLDSLRILSQNSTSHDFDNTSCDPATLHKAAFSEAIDWWTLRLNQTLLEIYSPMTYIDSAGNYVPAAHQVWMLNFEQLLARISAITRHPRDQSAQFMLMFPAMDILGDRFTGSGGIGQLMTPQRLRKLIAVIETHVPARIRLACPR